MIQSEHNSADSDLRNSAAGMISLLSRSAITLAEGPDPLASLEQSFHDLLAAMNASYGYILTLPGEAEPKRVWATFGTISTDQIVDAGQNLDKNIQQAVELPLPSRLGTRGVVLAAWSERLLDQQAATDVLSVFACQATAVIDSLHLSEAVDMAKAAKSKFVSVVTHELRLPMTSIKGYTDLMRQGIVGPVNEQQLSFLNIIRNNVERMSTLVSDLSDLTKIEDQRLKIDLTWVSLDDCVSDALINLKPRMDEKRQSLDMNVPAELPKVYADRNRVIQVLGYLLNNAWRYSPEEGKIRIVAFDQEDTVRFEVADTGIGISDLDQLKIFTPFFRSDDQVVRDQPGWGLGLSVASGLIALMGGKIGFTSTYEQGSVFWFTLPKSD